MNKKKIIETLYEVEEENYEFLHEKQESTLDTLYRLEDEIDEHEKELLKLKKARDLYEELSELELDDRKAVCQFMFDYASEYYSKHPVDKVGAMSLFEQAADYGGVEAKIQYASALLNGTYGFTSVEEAIAIFRELSEKDIAQAAYILFLLHEDYPELVEVDEALEMREKAMLLGYAPAMVPLPEGYDTRSNLEKLLERRKRGDRKVCYDLYLQTALNDEFRMNYLLEAADSFDPRAEKELATYYLKEDSKGEARELFLRAGQHGLPECYMLAADLLNARPRFYEVRFVEEVGKKQKEEFELFRKAAELNVVDAMTKVGLAYVYGFVTKKDIKAGLDLLKKAQRLGDSFEAPYWLGEFYWQGKIVGKNEKKAIRYLEVAGDKGNRKALLLLASIFHTGGDVIEVDEAKAKRYLFLAGEGRD